MDIQTRKSIVAAEAAVLYALGFAMVLLMAEFGTLFECGGVRFEG